MIGKTWGLLVTKTEEVGYPDIVGVWFKLSASIKLWDTATTVRFDKKKRKLILTTAFHLLNL